jgi:hypothetical protein
MFAVCSLQFAVCSQRVMRRDDTFLLEQLLFHTREFTNLLNMRQVAWCFLQKSFPATQAFSLFVP